MSARAAARKPVSRTNTGLSGANKATDSGIEDLKAEHAQLIEEMRQQVQRAELASEQYQSELEVLQKRLQEVIGDRDNLEDQISQSHADAQASQEEARDLQRRSNQLEQDHQAEKAMMLKEQDERATKAQELQGIVQRLNETIRQKELRAQVDDDRPAVSRSGMYKLNGKF
jgi:chromosome segregation ATPase